MRRSELEHLIRAAAAITDQNEIMVIGSQSILGSVPDAPAELLQSMEADLYPLRRSDLADLIDGAIGELSPFEKGFGYYAQRVGSETAFIPVGCNPVSSTAPVFGFQCRQMEKRSITGHQRGIHRPRMSGDHHVQRRQVDAFALCLGPEHSIAPCHIAVPRQRDHPVQELIHRARQPNGLRPARHAEHQLTLRDGGNTQRRHGSVHDPLCDQGMRTHQIADRAGVKHVALHSDHASNGSRLCVPP